MITMLVNSLTDGGAERVVLTLLDEFTAMGIEVNLVCLEREQMYEIPEGMQVHYLTKFENLKNPVLKTFWVFVAAYRMSRWIRKQNATFVQSHLTRSNFVNCAAKLFGARHRAQLVAHNTLELHKDVWPLRRLKGAFYSWLFRKAEEVVSISEMMRRETEEIMSLNRRRVNHKVIHNPHDLTKIQLQAKKSVEGFSFQSGKRYVIFAGRLVRLKRLEVLIEALSLVRDQLDNVELILLGDGEAKAYYQQIVRKHELDHCVHFVGYIANPFAYLAQSDVFVLPSEKEGLPNVIIEALACGLPVISSDCISGPREILSPDSDFSRLLTDRVEHGKYGVLVPVGRADLLAEAILDILGNEALWLSYVEGGRLRARDFDKQSIAERFLEAYSDQKVGSKTSANAPKMLKQN